MGRNYSRKETPTSSDLSLIWDSANSDWKLSPFTGIATLIGNLLTSLTSAIQQPTSQYLSPATGFSITLEGTDDTHLIMTPSTTLATGSIVLPISPGTVDKQRVTVTTSQEITALTVSGNGAAVVGGPSTISVGGYFELKYDMQTNSWYRVA
jgi:hypothetical protein